VPPNVTVLIPAYNEEATIGDVITDARDSGVDCHILVGDNNSTDSTWQKCVEKGVFPVMVSRKGKGNVIQALIKKVQTPYVIMVDADRTYPLQAAMRPIVNYLVDDYDVVTCPRIHKIDGAMSMSHKLGNLVLSRLASFIYRYPVTDLCTGLWGFRTPVLKGFGIKSKGFTLETEIFTKAISGMWSIKSCPITYHPRPIKSKSKLEVMDAIRIILYLWRNR